MQHYVLYRGQIYLFRSYCLLWNPTYPGMSSFKTTRRVRSFTWLHQNTICYGQSVKLSSSSVSLILARGLTSHASLAQLMEWLPNSWKGQSCVPHKCTFWHKSLRVSVLLWLNIDVCTKKISINVNFNMPLNNPHVTKTHQEVTMLHYVRQHNFAASYYVMSLKTLLSDNCEITTDFHLHPVQKKFRNFL